MVQGKFAMVIIAEHVARAVSPSATSKSGFAREGEKLGVRIYAQREDCSMRCTGFEVHCEL